MNYDFLAKISANTKQIRSEHSFADQNTITTTVKDNMELDT